MSDKEKRADIKGPKKATEGPGPPDLYTESVPFGHYGWVMPRILDEMGLDVFEFRLICHVKTVLAACGRCYQSTETMAKICKIGAASVSRAKTGLVSKGLLRVKTKGKKRLGIADELEAGDLWPWNMEEFGQQNPQEIKIPIGKNKSQPAVKIPIGKPGKRTRIILTNNTRPEPSDSGSAEKGRGDLSPFALGSDASAGSGKQGPSTQPEQLRLLPTRGPRKRARQRESTSARPKVRIPDDLFPWMHRLCFGADTTAKVRLLTKEQRGQVAQTLSIMVENLGAQALYDGLPRFRLWWVANWRSNDGSLPRPVQVRELWAEAMQATAPHKAHHHEVTPDADAEAGRRAIQRRNSHGTSRKVHTT